MMMMTKPAQATEKVLAQIVTPKEWLQIYEIKESGRVITREKIDTLTKVFHPGIIIGRDRYGRILVAHNHYSNGKPTFDTLEDFQLGKQFLWDTRSTKFTRQEIVQRAISEVLKGKEYKWANYNCQTYVNLVVRNEHSSEAVDKIADMTMTGGGVLALIGLLTGNRGLIAAGLGVAGVGGATKIYSKTR